MTAPGAPRGTPPAPWSGRCEISGAHGHHGALLGPDVELPHGVSGGPVLDQETGAVTGVVKARRTGKDGGLAIATTALRAFASAVPVGGERGLGDDPYRALIRAHDRWHDPRQDGRYDTRYGARRDPLHGAGDMRRPHASGPDRRAVYGRPNGGVSWAVAQEALRKGRAADGPWATWTPKDHLTALALLSELPAPAHPATVESHIETVLGEEPLWWEPTAPRDWRDGHGWLYESAEGDEVAFLHYLFSVAADCAHTAPEPAAALTHWARERVQRVPPTHRALLERLAALAEEAALPEPGPGLGLGPGPGPRPGPDVADREYGAPDAEHAPCQGRTEPHAVAARAADTEDGGPVVAVELEPAHYPQGEGAARDPVRENARFYWRIWTWTGDPDSVRAWERLETGQGATRHELPQQLAQPLRAAFARVDTDRRRARLELAAPVEHFDIDVHLWRPGLVARGLRPDPEDRQFGVHRQVVLREVSRTGAPVDTWEKRWNAALDGTLEALPLRTRTDQLGEAPARAVPVVCRTGDCEAPTLREVVRAGYGLALWSGTDTRPHTCDSVPHCELSARASELVRGARRAAALPESLRVLRERISTGDTAANWAEDLTLLYDDPRRPLPGLTLTEPLDSP
ncbi:hypothetical protein [Streptomyces iconiensis]|uniref:vWA-MoxR associated protein C-terminal domain-containing protein n=1 Tax=Streptomyces iconiensis TaxID=1384038 RepID=A0ABT7A1S8_9ACTN|nr:hypothetical protein [Streptomyces iconiensis]MDJ1135269.1 hypothetical protein [Streptomyces iconiensis]